MKFIVLFLALTGFLIIFKKDFRIIETTKQEWTGGRKKAGSGVNYRITIVAETTSKKLKLQEIWVNRKLITHKLFNLTDNEPGNTFGKKDTLILTGTVIVNESANLNKTEEEPPFLYNEEVVIGYKLKNRILYRPVSEIKTLKASSYK